MFPINEFDKIVHDEFTIEPLKASELTNEARQAIIEAKKGIIRGKTIPAEQVFKDLGL